MSVREFVENHRKLESDISQAVYDLISQYEKSVGLSIESIDIDLLHQHCLGGNRSTISVIVSAKTDISE